MIIRCKMCGGELAFATGSTVCECEYCGSRQTVPGADSERKTNLFNRANRLRMNSEFDKAAALYETIAAEFPEEAEVYWGLCLCAYGIEYVDDPATGRKLPTCHRTVATSIMRDADFEKACDYADVIARRVYREEAKAIDRIQQTILSIASGEAPYDVFICYKELDEHGNRTEDSVLSQDIYDALTGKGLKVFFSRITLENKLGLQYEPYIYAALSSAKVLLAVGTQFEYYDAVWVKNEWGRYLRMMRSDRQKCLIPCFKGLDAYDIPEEFKGLQGQDMGKLGWLQDLVRGVEKLCGRDQIRPATVQGIQGIIQQAPTEGVTTANLLKRARIFLADQEWDKAETYFEKVLDISAECAPAYVGKLCVELRLKGEEQLAELRRRFSDSGLWIKAKRFATDDQRTEYKRYEDAVAANIEEDRRREQEERRQEREQLLLAAEQMIERKEYAHAYYLFGVLGDRPGCRERACESMMNWVSRVRSLKKQYESGQSECTRLRTELSQLRGLFIGGKKRTLQSLVLSMEQRVTMLQSQLLHEGITCDDLAKVQESGEPTKAERRFLESVAERFVQGIGSRVTLGCYHGAPLEWQVLTATDDTRVLLSVKGIDAVCYNKRLGDGNGWETSYIRSWLNGYFYNTAFSADERASMKVDGSGDLVSLLTDDDAEEQSLSIQDRICHPTEAAGRNGAASDESGAAVWWLKSSGNDRQHVRCVKGDGTIDPEGCAVDDATVTVRPVVVLCISERDQRRAADQQRRRKQELDYQAAMKKYGKRDFVRAYWRFRALGNYSDSRGRARECATEWVQEVRTLYHATRQHEQSIMRLQNELDGVHGLFTGGKKWRLQTQIENLTKQVEDAKRELQQREAPYGSLSVLAEYGNITPAELRILERSHAGVGNEPVSREGQIVTLGCYEGIPLEWRILAADGETEMLISTCVLEVSCFNKSRNDGNTWDTSFIRAWLNEAFHNAAFSENEKAQMTDCTTGDRVMLLSTEEAEGYFAFDTERLCRPTENARRKGADVDINGMALWWLRSSGDEKELAAMVDMDGRINRHGCRVTRKGIGIRPVITLRVD